MTVHGLCGCAHVREGETDPVCVRLCVRVCMCYCAYEVPIQS